MSHKEDLEILYDKPISIGARHWFEIQTNYRILNLLSIQDIQYLNYIATSVKLSGKPTKKKEMITQLMEQRNFKRIDCGTNRIVFKYMEDQSIVLKIAFDKVAINDNLREFRNQEFLKPFCAKCFEVSSCGTVGLFERVHPVKNKEQFLSIADRVFDIIVNCFLGKYVLADFGTNYYKNWGVRKGMCPVILDYPYLYELDSGKIYCNNQDPNSPTGYCGGEIDYDDGFNFLVCEKCGKVYLASELSKSDNKHGGLIVDREENYMNITIEKNGKKIVLGEEKETTTYKKLSRKEYKMKKAAKSFTVSFERGDHEEPEKKEAQPIRMATSRELQIDKDCESLEVNVTTREGKKYVGKSKAQLVNPYATVEPTANIYGTGATYIDQKDSKDETVYTDPDNDNFSNNMAEIIKNISLTNGKEREDNSAEEINEDIKDEVIPTDNVYDEFGNAVNEDLHLPETDQLPTYEDDTTISMDDSSYYETENYDEYSEQEIMDEF